MELQALIEQVKTYNESEVLYKKYQESSYDADARRAFLSTIDQAWAKENWLLLPELIGQPVSIFLESWVFRGKANENVAVLKHNRYTPSFVHLHDYWELLYVLDGQCTHKAVGQTMRLCAGDLCMIPPGTEHELSVNDDSLILNLILRASSFERLFQPVLLYENVLTRFFHRHLSPASPQEYLLFHTQNDNALRQMLLTIYLECVNKPMGFEQTTLLLTQQMMFMLMRSHASTAESALSRPVGLVQHYEMIVYIHAHYRSITLQELAEYFHYTPEYISKLIRQLTGQTFMDILHSVRVKEAKLLLENTAMSVHAISDAVGYANPESFIRVFRKETGMSPTAFRKAETVRGAKLAE